MLPTLVFWPGEFQGLYSPWGHKESGMTELVMVLVMHREVGDGQGRLPWCSSWGCKESNMTEWLNWNEWHVSVMGAISIKTKMKNIGKTLESKNITIQLGMIYDMLTEKKKLKLSVCTHFFPQCLCTILFYKIECSNYRWCVIILTFEQKERGGD